MKTRFLTFAFLLVASIVHAVTFTGLLTVTNAPAGLTNQTLTIDGATLFWTTNSPLQSNQMSITNTTAQAATNLYSAATNNATIVGISYSVKTNSVIFSGGQGAKLNFSNDWIGWATLSIITNGATGAVSQVYWPAGNLAASTATQQSQQVVADLQNFGGLGSGGGLTTNQANSLIASNAAIIVSNTWAVVNMFPSSLDQSTNFNGYLASNDVHLVLNHGTYKMSGTRNNGNGYIPDSVLLITNGNIIIDGQYSTLVFSNVTTSPNGQSSVQGLQIGGSASNITIRHLFFMADPALTNFEFDAVSVNGTNVHNITLYHCGVTNWNGWGFLLNGVLPNGVTSSNDTVTVDSCRFDAIGNAVVADGAAIQIDGGRNTRIVGNTVGGSNFRGLEIVNQANGADSIDMDIENNTVANCAQEAIITIPVGSGVIRGFKFIGNHATSTASYTNLTDTLLSMFGIPLYDVKWHDNTFDNLSTNGSGPNPLVRIQPAMFPEGATLGSTYVKGSKGAGVSLTGAPSGGGLIKLLNWTVLSNATYGIDAAFTTNLTLTGCVLSNNTTADLLVESSAQSVALNGNSISVASGNTIGALQYAKDLDPKGPITDNSSISIGGAMLWNSTLLSQSGSVTIGLTADTNILYLCDASAGAQSNILKTGIIVFPLNGVAGMVKTDATANAVTVDFGSGIQQDATFTRWVVLKNQGDQIFFHRIAVSGLIQYHVFAGNIFSNLTASSIAFGDGTKQSTAAFSPIGTRPFVTNAITAINTSYTMPGTNGYAMFSVTITTGAAQGIDVDLTEYTSTATNCIAEINDAVVSLAQTFTLQGPIDAGYTTLAITNIGGLGVGGSVTVNGSSVTHANRINFAP